MRGKLKTKLPERKKISEVLKVTYFRDLKNVKGSGRQYSSTLGRSPPLYRTLLRTHWLWTWSRSLLCNDHHNVRFILLLFCSILLLLLFVTIHLMSDSEGNSQFCFPESPDVSREEVEGNTRTRRKTKLIGFPRDLTVSVLLYF